MWWTLAEMMPFAVAGAFLPTWTLVVVVLLGTRRPRQNALAFILGNATFRATLGIAVLFGFEELAAEGIADPTIPRDPWLITASAALLLGLAVLAWSRPDQPSRSNPRWMSTLERTRPAAAFGLGVLLVAAPGAQYVYFLAGMGILASSGLSTQPKLVLLALFVVSLQLMLTVPLFVHAAFPNRATRLLESLKRWVESKGRLVGTLILTLAGVYAAWEAARAFAAR